MFLRQSTASQEILLGPFVDSTDGVTAETGLTIANTDIQLWKSGTTVEANKNSGGATHIASGRYHATLDATDTDTVGMLEINVAVSGALPVRRTYYVLEEAVYDALFAASSAGYATAAHVAAVETDTQDIQSRLPAALVSGRIDASVGAMAANTVTASALATDAVAEIQSGLATAAALSTAQTSLDGLGTAVADIPTVAEFEARSLPSADYFIVSDYTTPPTAGAIADAVWDEARTGHTTSGTFGFYLDAAISGVSTGGVSAGDIATAVRTELTTELGRIDAAISTRLATSGYTAPDVPVNLFIHCDNAGRVLLTTSMHWWTGTAWAPLRVYVDSDRPNSFGLDGPGHWHSDTALPVPTKMFARFNDTVYFLGNRPAGLSASTTLFFDPGTFDITIGDDIDFDVYNQDTSITGGTTDSPGLPIDALGVDLRKVLDDTNELQTDWANGGRLDLLLDTTVSQTAASAIKSGCRSAIAGRWTNAGTGADYDDITIGDTP